MITAATPACGSDSATPTGAATSTTSTGAGGETGSGGAAPTGWAATDCGACAQQACASYIASCDSDPECPAYLTCVLACPAADGAPTVDPACAAACSTGSSSESKLAAADVYACFTVGDGATTCSACGDMIAPPAGLPPETCTPATGDPCGQCESGSCCNELGNCGTGSDCDNFITCVMGCHDGEAACYTECAGSNPSGEAAFAQVDACTEYWCKTECGQPTACDQCRLSTCRVETYNLKSSPDGLLLFECWDQCIHGVGATPAPCEDQCFADHMDQRDLFDAYEECLVVGCKDQCMPGE